MADSLRIVTGGGELAPAAAKLLSQCFDDDPVMAYFFNHMTREERVNFLPTFFHYCSRSAAIAKCKFMHANEWSSLVILAPPGSDVNGTITGFRAGMWKALWQIGVGGMQRMVTEYVDVSNSKKKKYLGTDKYYYVYLCATHETARGRGLCSALLRQCTEIADTEGHPMWLEATTDRSHRVYERAGFETMEVMTVGKGKADATGARKAGGEGVSTWLMVYRPSKKA